MKTIQLNRGREVLVSDVDYEYLSQWRWQYHTRGAGRSNEQNYAVRNVKRDGHWKKLYMHKIVAERMGYDVLQKTDHHNGDTLNNRRGNLRQATGSQNAANVGVKRNNKTGFKGISRTKSGKWTASHCGKYLGTFSQKELAAKIYDVAAIAKHGEFARLNFPSIQNAPIALAV